MDFKEAIGFVSEINPNLCVQEALEFAERLENGTRLPISSTAELTLWALGDEEIVKAAKEYVRGITQSGKIPAIQKIRHEFQCSLPDAKAAVEHPLLFGPSSSKPEGQ